MADLPHVTVAATAPPTVALALAVRPGPTPDPRARGYGVDAAEVLARERLPGHPGEILAIPLPRPEDPRLLLLVGVGDESAASLRRAGAAVARAARSCATLAIAVDRRAPSRRAGSSRGCCSPRTRFRADRSRSRTRCTRSSS